MKESRNRLLVGVSVAAFAALLAIWPGFRAAASADSVSAPELEGTWRITIDFNGPLTSLQTFLPGGVFLESNSRKANVRHGVWQKVGPHTYVTAFEALREDGLIFHGEDLIQVDPASGVYNRVRGTGQVRDLTGNVISTNCSEGGTATRVGVENILCPD